MNSSFDKGARFEGDSRWRRPGDRKTWPWLEVMGSVTDCPFNLKLLWGEAADGSSRRYKTPWLLANFIEEFHSTGWFKMSYARRLVVLWLLKSQICGSFTPDGEWFILQQYCHLKTEPTSVKLVDQQKKKSLDLFGIQALLFNPLNSSTDFYC